MKTTLGELRRIIREAPDFKKGDEVLFGKYKNKKGKIIAVYDDEKGHPTIDIEPVPKGRKKTVTMGLYKVWAPKEKFDESALHETRNDWVVRKGAEVLVKGVDDPPNAWHYEELQKVTYFTMDELVDFPSGLSSPKNFKFERDGKLYAVAERQFFLMPPRTQG